MSSACCDSSNITSSPAAACTPPSSWPEAQLNTRLLLRSTRKLTLTSAGQAFHQRCAAAVDDLAAASQASMIGSEQPAGRLAPVLPQYSSASFGLHAMYPTRQHLPAVVAALIDLVRDRLNAIPEKKIDAPDNSV